MVFLLVGVLTSFCATARTIRTSVVGLTGTVVVSEFNDYKVSFLEQVSDVVEAAFAGEGAGRSTGECFVDDGDF